MVVPAMWLEAVLGTPFLDVAGFDIHAVQVRVVISGGLRVMHRAGCVGFSAEIIESRSILGGCCVISPCESLLQLSAI